ncbi:MAG TPA: serine hydrolase domain-containing protein [Blastocatellia bacterium]|nr:serine hydrolase domain-containing protein [Blastocatellia bacterium]
MLRRQIASLFLFVSLVVTSNYGPAVAQQKTQPDFGELERVVLDELKETNTPGAAVGIISGDRVIFAKGFGVSNTETGAPVTPDMLFRLGSTTKMFTAAALVTLAEQGKIKLDAPIGNYVKGLNPRIAAVTAHQLLSHTAGIIDEAPMYGRHDDAALGEEIRSWKEDKLFTEPGRIISYSNPGYWLAGLVIEEVGGKPYADQMSESLFKPLGMNSTTLRPTVAMTFPLSQGHNPARSGTPTVIRPFADNSASWPAGSMFSSVADLSRFAIAFLNEGKIDGKQVLSPAVIERLSAGHAAIPGNPDRKYGYGLMTGTYRGVKLFEHGGSRSGYGSTISMAPEYHFAVIVLANRSGASLNKTVAKAMELMLPLKAKEEEKTQKIAMTAAEMAGYAGLYSQGGTRVEIFIKDGKLMGRQDNAEGLITRTGGQSFSIAMPNGPSTFALVPGSDGKAEYLHMGLRSLKRSSK